MREVLKQIKVKKAKCVIMSPTIDRIRTEGGLNDFVGNILDLCAQNKVPVVYGLKRKQLGKALGKRSKISIVAVLEGDEGYLQYCCLFSLFTCCIRP